MGDGGRAHKVVLVGNSSCGKTSIVLRISRGTFLIGQEPTIGAAFVSKTIQMGDGCSCVTLHIWDTAGEERYASLVPKYSRGAEAIIVVYDCTERETFDGAKEWVTKLREYHSEDIAWFLVANKIDLVAQVDSGEAEAYAASDHLRYFETSAKTGQGIQELFYTIAECCPSFGDEQGGIQLDTREEGQGRRKCC